jgi:NAD(P)-dependent dehydrogenase (short-subunit alcohol dehydrogenase family)
VSRLALVTGGAQGIGEAIVRRLAADGDDIIIADLQGGLATEVADHLAREHGVAASAIEVDVSDAAAVAAMAERVHEEHGALDVLVNDAGIANMHATLEHPDDVWDQTIGTNLGGVFYMCRAFGGPMQKRGGAVVNIASVAGMRATGPEVHVAYDASKAGVIMLTRTLAAEWVRHGVRVNAVAPGYTETPILAEVGVADPDILATWKARIPMDRFVQPAEIAAGVAFLASDDASAITGHTLPIDAGYLCR